MTLAILPSPNFTGADLSARLNAALTEARAARRFATLPALLADATLAYGAGARPVAAGDLIEAGGHRYEVAAAGTSDHHLTTAGGVRLYALASADGRHGAPARAVPHGGAVNAAPALSALFAQGPRDYTGAGQAYHVTGTFIVGGGSDLDRFDLTGSTGGSGTMVLAAGAENVRIHDLTARLTSGHVLGITDSSARNVLLDGWNVETDRFPVLLNDSAPGGSTLDSLIVTGSILHSTHHDAIELNTFRGNARHFVGAGLILEAGTDGTSNLSGFPYGNAGMRYSVLAGAVIRESRQDAVHIEDRQKGTVVAAISGHGLKDHGVNILADGVSAPAIADMDGVVATGLHLTHEGARTGFHGVNINYDANGALPLNVVGDSYLKGFDAALYLGGDTGTSPQRHIMQMLDGIVGDGCNVGVLAGRRAVHLGEVVLRDTPVLARADGGARIGRVASMTTPATILQKAGTDPIGAVMRGFLFPVTITHTTGAINHTLFALPTRMQGRLTLSMLGTNRFFYMANVKWDGTTLTVTDAMKRELGSAGGIALLASAGNLQVTVNSTSASADPCLAEFDGVFYQE